MPREHLTKKSVPSSAGKAASGVFSGHRAARQGSDSATKSGKGHFAGAMMRLAKLRTDTLQQGNVLTKKAPMGGAANFDSDVDEPEGQGRIAQSSEGQTALNPKQQGPSSKHMQRGKGVK